MNVLYEKRGRVAYVTINRPEARNAIDKETAQALSKTWEDFRDDDTLWVAVLTGAGDKSFSAGADLKSLIPSLTDTGQAPGQTNDGGFGASHEGLNAGNP